MSNPATRLSHARSSSFASSVSSICLKTPPLLSPEIALADIERDEHPLVSPRLPCFELRGLSAALSTPPRPPRRSSARRRANKSPSTILERDDGSLLPPPTQVRAYSPSADSLSTISEAASSPRTKTCRERLDTPIPHRAASPTQGENGDMTARKRNSTQRRLVSLRGLVENLDFNQPWSTTEGSFDKLLGQDDVFWGFDVPMSGDGDERPEYLSSTMPLVRDVPPHRPRPKRITGTLASAKSHNAEPTASLPRLTQDQVDVLPDRQSSLGRKITPAHSRRPRHARSASDLLSKIPEPPRPASRQRREVFEVASSGYSKCMEPASPLLPPNPGTTWRSSLSKDRIYHELLCAESTDGIKRQEIIWEMCATELTFVKSMRTVLRLFTVPLKTPQGKWIQGIPERITSLFDLLESVTRAHEMIVDLQKALKQQSEVVDLASFVKSLSDWMPMLRSHEDYLCKFEGVVQLVEENVRDKDSVFGEFVRMQMKEEALGSMTLGSMLLKPVQRLTKYPLFPRRLLEVTPYCHPCHSRILALLSGTEAIISDLQAAKALEEEFQQLQIFESGLQGLPTGFRLGVRGRRLLGYGSVVRVVPAKGSAVPFSRTTSTYSSRESVTSSVSSAYSSPWESYLLSPSTARTSQYSEASASPRCPPSRSTSMTQLSSQRPSVSRSPSSVSAPDLRSSTIGSLRALRKKEDVLLLLIFNDLVVLATERPDRGSLFSKRKAETILKVLDTSDGGIGSVVDIRPSLDSNGHISSFAISMVPWGAPSSSSQLIICCGLPTGASRPSGTLPSTVPHLTTLDTLLAAIKPRALTDRGEHQEGKGFLRFGEPPVAR